MQSKNNWSKEKTMSSESNLISIDNVKCKYILDIIFSYVPHNNKMLLAQYNKKLQKNFDFDIGLYKRRTRKYRTIEKYGIGKEFNLDNKLIFEGEYKNKRKDGEGKEYHECNGKIKFEGKYLKGKRWNGIGYNLDGEKDFEIIEEMEKLKNIIIMGN